MRGLLVLATTTVALCVAVVVACSPSYPTCYRGEYQGCACGTGAKGYQACNVTEDGFQACVCDGTTPGVDGGRDSGALASEAGAGGGYLAACGANGTCSVPGDVCFSFPSKGTICTRKCTTASDCPAPSPGCTPSNGVCRAP